MKKYTRPELICECFSAEDVLTTSGTAPTYVSSMNLLKEEIAADPMLGSYALSNSSWE